MRTISAALLSLCVALAHAMPPLPAHRAAIYAYYKLEWLPDGYPGRATRHGVVAHPLYGTYVIKDYLREWQADGRPEYLEGARKVADAALRRMQPLEDALVFYYTPETGLSALPGTFYSALTQARWMATFDDLYQATGDTRYRDAAQSMLRSLAIPVERGGVLKQLANGVTLEEYPHKVPTYTLNGWLTTMTLLERHARHGSALARDLLERNLTALEAMLPLYDLPEIANSRYQLANSAQLRFSGARVVDVKVEIPGEGIFGLGDRHQWSNYLEDRRNNDRQYMNAILSYVSFPQPNILHVTTKTPEPLKVEIGTAEYDPTVTALPTRSWKSLGTFLGRDGRISIPIPWEAASLVAYPTAFTKKIAGKSYNVYHFVHIQTLDELYASTQRPFLKHYADKWRGYAARWERMPLYTSNAQRIELTPYKSRLGTVRETGKQPDRAPDGAKNTTPD